MFKQVATILNRLVDYLFTALSLATETKPCNIASNLPVKSGQQCKDVQAPVKQKRKPKPKVVLQTTQEALHKQTQNPVLAVLGQGGLQRQIRASKTNQPVKPAVKRKPKAVKSIKAALLSQLEQAPALTPTEVQFGERGKRKTTVSKTPQRAKTAQTQKRKAADSTTQGKKPIKSKTSAKTPTVRQRKVRGA